MAVDPQYVVDCILGNKDKYKNVKKDVYSLNKKDCKYKDKKK